MIRLPPILLYVQSPTNSSIYFLLIAAAFSSQSETPAHSWCVILTMSVAPSQSMSNTQRWAPQLRLREYEASLRHWATSYPHPVYVVESSGANLDWFRSAAPGLDYVSLHLNTTPPVLGKGHAEYLSIKGAVDRWVGWGGREKGGRASECMKRSIPGDLFLNTVILIMAGSTKALAPTSSR